MGYISRLMRKMHRNEKYINRFARIFWPCLILSIGWGMFTKADRFVIRSCGQRPHHNNIEKCEKSATTYNQDQIVDSVLSETDIKQTTY